MLSKTRKGLGIMIFAILAGIISTITFSFIGGGTGKEVFVIVALFVALAFTIVEFVGLSYAAFDKDNPKLNWFLIAWIAILGSIGWGLVWAIVAVAKNEANPAWVSGVTRVLDVFSTIGIIEGCRVALVKKGQKTGFCTVVEWIATLCVIGSSVVTFISGKVSGETLETVTIIYSLCYLVSSILNFINLIVTRSRLK